MTWPITRRAAEVAAPGGIGISVPAPPNGQSCRLTPLANAKSCETVIAGGAETDPAQRPQAAERGRRPGTSPGDVRSTTGLGYKTKHGRC